MQLELGDIIKLFSSELEDYNDKVFVITFLNNENLVIQNIVSNEVHRHPIKNGILLNKLIDNIHLLKRHELKGFVLQNKMAVNMWIDIHGIYNSDIPFSWTGKITNIEEDMIEVSLHGLEEEAIIYIDFAYQGISPDSNIKKIHIRDKPIDDAYSQNMDMEEIGDTSSKNVTSETINIDKIIYHEDFLEAIQVKEIKHSHNHTYSLEAQINDMVEDILANNSRPSKELLGEIFVLSERYKVLYKKYIFESKKRRESQAQSQTQSQAQPRPISQHEHGVINVVANKPMLFIDSESVSTENIRVADTDLHLNKFIQNINEQYSTNSYAERYIRTQEIIKDFYQIDDLESVENTEVVKNRTVCIESNLQELPNEIQGYGVCVEITKLNRQLIVNTALDKSSFKPVICLPGDRINVDSLVYLPESLCLNEHAKLPSTTILNKAIINNIGFTNYNVNIKKLYEPVFVSDKMNINSDDVLDKLFVKYLHFKYDSSKMSYQEFKDNMELDKSKMILQLLRGMNTTNLSLYSILKYIHKYSFDNDDINNSIYDSINDAINSKLHAIKKDILTTNSDNTDYANIENPNEVLISDFSQKYKKHVDLYTDLQPPATSETVSHMIEMDNMNLFTSSLLLTKNDFIDFTKFDKSATQYIASNDGILNRNKCSKYYLSKQYHTIEQLEADNSRTIYFDKEFDKTNYSLFNEEQLENREECIKKLIEQYKVPEKDANYEYESMVNKNREVKEGDFALLYMDGKFIMFKRNKKNEWEATNQFSGMSGKEIFCNIQSDCFAIPSNNCSNLKDKQKVNTVQDAKDSVNDFDKDIIMKKAVFKEMMLKQYDQQLVQLSLIKQHKDNQSFKQSRLLYKIGTRYIPSDAEESPYVDIFHSILNIKDLDLKYSNLIKFCANFTRDANLLVEDESPHWKYCVKTNMKLVPFFMYRLAVSYHTTKTYAQELNNICNDTRNSAISDDGDKFIDKNSGYVIKEIDYSDNYSPESAPIKVIAAPEINKYSAVNDISKEYKHYIVNIVESMCSNMVITLQDSQKEHLMRNVVNDFNKYFESRPINDTKKKEKVHSHYIMYYTLSYLAIEILTSIPSIRTNDNFPGCVKSFTGFPVTDKSDVSGLLYIACVAFRMAAKNNYPWKALKNRMKDSDKPNPELVCANIQVFLEKITTKTSVQKKINSKIRDNDKKQNIQERVVIKPSKMFLPPQSQYDIAFTITKGLVGLNRSQLLTKSFYYSISLFKTIQDLVKDIVDKSVPIVNEPLLDPINKPYSFMANKKIKDDLVELAKIKDLLDKKHFTKVFHNHKTYDLHFPIVFNGFLKKKDMMNDFILRNIDEYEDEIREMFSDKMPDDVPRDKVEFTEMLKQYGINISIADFNKIYKLKNLKTLFNSSELYAEQMDIKSDFENLRLSTPQNTCISTVHDMLYNGNRDEYENKIIEDIEENVNNIIDFVFLNVSKKQRSDRTKFETVLRNLVKSTMDITDFWEPIRKSQDEVNIFSDINNETIQNATNSISNVIDFLTRNLPEIIKRKIRGENIPDFKNVLPPNHWNLSQIHRTDIMKLTKQYYSFIEKYSNCSQETHELFDTFSSSIKNTSQLCALVKRYYNANTNHDPNKKSVYLCILYILFDTIKTLVETTSNTEDKGILECVANVVYDVIAMNYLSDKFKQINTSYDDVYSHINRIKESEKNTILRKLEQMNDEQRDVDNEFKKYSIGDWSSGNYRTYDKSEYDQGRLSDMYKDNDFMTQLLGAVYEDRDRNAEDDIDLNEAFDMSDVFDDDNDPNSDE